MEIMFDFTSSQLGALVSAIKYTIRRERFLLQEHDFSNLSREVITQKHEMLEATCKEIEFKINFLNQ